MVLPFHTMCGMSGVARDTPPLLAVEFERFPVVVVIDGDSSHSCLLLILETSSTQMFALLRLIPLREAPWPGGSVAGSPEGPLLMSRDTIPRGYVMKVQHLRTLRVLQV